MPKMKRDVAELRKRGINSLVLGIELFNRPCEGARPEAVLILLHHAFEMLLKAAIRDKTGTIHAKGSKYTYSFDQCLEIAHVELGVITGDEKSVLSILDAHRDTALHYYQDISEDLLYLQAQGSVTLFDDLLKREWDLPLAELVPSRVLPVSTRPPKDLRLLVDSEFSQIDDLLKAGTRKGRQAAARLRSVLALTAGIKETDGRVSEGEIHKALTRRRRGHDWSVIMPELAHLRLDAEGEGIPISLRIKRHAPFGVRVAQPDEPVVGTLLKQDVNIWDKFNLGRDDLADKLGLTGPRTSALIHELGILDDPDCFHELRRKSQRMKGYSKKALDRLREALNSGIDMDEVWQKHRHRFGAGRRKRK